MKSFYIRSRVVKNIGILYPKGHLDSHNVERFEKELLNLFAKNIFNIIINCKESLYISSHGMGIIMGYFDEARDNRGDIKLCCVSKRVYEIFDLVGFNEIFDILKDEQSAIDKFNESGE